MAGLLACGIGLQTEHDMTEIEVGQTVYLENIDHRRFGTDGLTPYKVVKLGRKWATLDSWNRLKFDIVKNQNGVRSVYEGGFSPSHRAWLSPEEHADFIIRNETWREFVNFCANSYPPNHLSKEQLLLMLQQIKGPAK